jgi:hypothetical protein
LKKQQQSQTEWHKIVFATRKENKTGIKYYTNRKAPTALKFFKCTDTL